MVSIMSSLRTVESRGACDAETLRAPVRSIEPLDFPKIAQKGRSAADLARMIESEIIPRLMLAHGSAEVTAPVRPGAVGPRTLDAFARMTLASEAPALTSYIGTLIQGGLSLEEIYVDLLIPTARRLGDDWNEDLVSFTDVTIGLSRLQQVVRMLGGVVPSREADDAARSAYFAPAPQEQHAFGLCILEDYFRRAGWRTRLDTAATRGAAARTVADGWFDMFGLSATSDTPIEVIASTIAQVRRSSRNRDLFVMVGGRIFVDDPNLATTVGADATSATAADALSLAADAIHARATA